MESLKNKQSGISAIETASFLMIITVLTFAIFLLGAILTTRYLVDTTLETALSTSAVKLVEQVTTGNGTIEYRYKPEFADDLISEISINIKSQLEDSRFLKSLPYRFDISLYRLSIDPATGNSLGFMDLEVKINEGSLQVPPSILGRHSIKSMQSSINDNNLNSQSIYAEPSPLVVYQSSTKKYLPFSPILTSCLYVADRSVLALYLLEKFFPQGVIASCQMIKVREFI